MKIKDMKEEDVKKLKSSLYKLIDNDFKMINFKGCDSKTDFYDLIYYAHERIVNLVFGFLFCYKLYIDMKFDISKEGLPLASDIEKELIKKYYEVWNNDKTRKR